MLADVAAVIDHRRVEGEADGGDPGPGAAGAETLHRHRSRRAKRIERGLDIHQHGRLGEPLPLSHAAGAPGLVVAEDDAPSRPVVEGRRDRRDPGLRVQVADIRHVGGHPVDRVQHDDPARGAAGNGAPGFQRVPVIGFQGYAVGHGFLGG